MSFDTTLLISYLDYLAFSTLIIISILYVVVGSEDFLLDMYALIKNLKPSPLRREDLALWQKQEQRRLAIMIPAWDESSVIGRMLTGNLASIEYENYDFFVGVYPNDLKTIKAVNQISQINPRVHMVVNSANGPTSKGQILNKVVEYILNLDSKIDPHSNESFHGIIMHDAEDIISPKSLILFNELLNYNDFVQIPVYSLGRKKHQLVAGTYMDEFAESHTKDLLVRASMGAAIPSAGVGTGLSLHLVKENYANNAGAIFDEGSLTEDYVLGVRTHLNGLKSHFACMHYFTPDGNKNLIATREFFPKKIQQSIRQKTRWSLGISFQGWSNLGWKGSFSNLYFLYRDRRAPWINISILIGYITLIYILVSNLLGYNFAKTQIENELWLHNVLLLNVFFLLNRTFQRMNAVTRVYGVSEALIVPFRWPVAIFINGIASLRAISQLIQSKLTNKSTKWEKTDHDLPESFGAVVNQ